MDGPSAPRADLYTPRKRKLTDPGPETGRTLLTALSAFVHETENHVRSMSDWRTHIEQTLLHTRAPPIITQSDFFKWKMDLKVEILDLVESKIEAEVKKRMQEHVEGLDAWRQEVMRKVHALERKGEGGASQGKRSIAPGGDSPAKFKAPAKLKAPAKPLAKKAKR